MPETQHRPPPVQAPPPVRTDIGHRRVTGPATDDNRGDRSMRESEDSQSIASQMQVDPYAWMSGYDPYGYGAYGGGGYRGYGEYDPYGYEGSYYNGSYTGGAGPQLEEKWGEADQTSLTELEEDGAIREYGEESVLVIANGPEDLRQLDHNAEADMIANAMGEGRKTVVLWNPSAEALQAMLKEGKFKDVVLSGHGGEGTVYMTGTDGESVAVDGKTFAGYFENSGVQNVFLNMCHGAGGENSVAEALSVAQMNVMGWTSTVKDSVAQSTASVLGGMLADGTSISDMHQTAQGNANLQVIAAKDATTPAPVPIPLGVAPEVTAPEATTPPEAAAAVADGVTSAGGGYDYYGQNIEFAQWGSGNFYY